MLATSLKCLKTIIVSRLKVALLLLVGAFLLAGTVHAASDCAEILPYIREHSDERSRLSNFSRLLDDILSDKYSSSKEAEDQAHKFGLGFASFEVNVEGDERDRFERDWRDILRHKMLLELRTNNSFSKTVDTALDIGVRAWSECIRSKGLHVWNASDPLAPNTLVLAASYVSSDTRYPTTTIKNNGFHFTPSDGVVCSANSDRTIGSEVTLWTCTRSQGASVTMVLRTFAGDRTVTFKASPPCRPDVITKQESSCPHGEEGTVSLKMQVCKDGVSGNDDELWTEIGRTCRPTPCRTAEEVVEELAKLLWGDGKLSREETNRFAETLRSAQHSVRGLAELMVRDPRFLAKHLNNRSPLVGTNGTVCSGCPGFPGWYHGAQTDYLVLSYGVIANVYATILQKPAPQVTTNVPYYGHLLDQYFSQEPGKVSSIVIDPERIANLSVQEYIRSKEWTERFGENGVPNAESNSVIRFCGNASIRNAAGLDHAHQ